MSAEPVRVFWMSFADTDLPEGKQNLGVCIVEVTADDIAEAAVYMSHHFPHALPGAEVVLAATRKAWSMGCNPGGQVASWDITDSVADIVHLPRHKLLSKADLALLDSPAGSA